MLRAVQVFRCLEAALKGTKSPKHTEHPNAWPAVNHALILQGLASVQAPQQRVPSGLLAGGGRGAPPLFPAAADWRILLIACSGKTYLDANPFS